MTDKLGFIGVDPGSPLSFGLIGYKGNLRAVATDEIVATKSGGKWNNSPALAASILHKWMDSTNYPLVMVIELVSGRVGEGVVSSGKFVGSMWLMMGMAAAMEMPYYTVTPAKWKKDMKLKGGDAGKDMSRDLAAKLWQDKAGLFKFKYSHNIAEAGLIGRWAHQHRDYLGV